MKYLILILLLISFNSLACNNKLPVSEAIKAVNLESGAGSKSCKDLPNEQCLDFCGIDFEKSDLVDVMVFDYATKSETETCSDEANCDTIHAAKICADTDETAIKNYGTLEVYCSKNVYVATGSKKFQLNSAKVSNIDTKRLAEINKAAIMSLIRKAKVCGESVIDEIIYRNSVVKTPALNKGQKKLMLQNYKEIMQLLRVGNLEQARDDIQAATVDGVLVTNDDVTVLVAMLNKCLGV